MHFHCNGTDVYLDARRWSRTEVRNRLSIAGHGFRMLLPAQRRRCRDVCRGASQRGTRGNTFVTRNRHDVEYTDRIGLAGDYSRLC